jgi:hypothetical protein
MNDVYAVTRQNMARLMFTNNSANPQLPDSFTNAFDNGTNNQIGRWVRAPKSSEKRRVNLGTQADFAISNFSGVWLDSDVQFESEVLPVDPNDTRTLKSTWIYYPYNGGTNLWSGSFPINGPGRDKVATVRMSSDESVRMVQAPQPVATVPAPPVISGGNSEAADTSQRWSGGRPFTGVSRGTLQRCARSCSASRA